MEAKLKRREIKFGKKSEEREREEMSLCLCSFAVCLFSAVTLGVIFWRRRMSVKESITVVVLGDIGRSPRMQYHSLCFARCQRRSGTSFSHVDLVGARGEAASAAVQSECRISVHAMGPFPGLSLGIPRGIRRFLFLFYAPLKVVFQVAQLFTCLVFRCRPCSHVLVQNPPSLPTLPVAWLACRLCGAKLVVDWHNLGHTLLAMSLGASHPLVYIAEAVERTFGARLADAHLCVTEAMMEHLRSHKWGKVPPSVPIAVLRDRPHSATFHVLSSEQKAAALGAFVREQLETQATTERQKRIMRTAADEAGKELRQRSVAVVVSSTSWTPDEDFSVLLDALRAFEQDKATDGKEGKELLVVITGKGPEKEAYVRKIASMDMKRVAIVTAWLRLEDYPKVLACADVGVSLHQSSSQIDLPMKVLDMFGTGLPVFARWYPCLERELVQENVTGRTFRDSSELARCFQVSVTHSRTKLPHSQTV